MTHTVVVNSGHPYTYISDYYAVCVVVNSLYIVHTDCELMTHTVGVNSRHPYTVTLTAGIIMPCVFSCELTKLYTRIVNS